MLKKKEFTVPIFPERNREEEFQLKKFIFNTAYREFNAIDTYVLDNMFQISLHDAKNCCHRMSNLLQIMDSIYFEYDKYVPFQKGSYDARRTFERRWTNQFTERAYDPKRN